MMKPSSCTPWLLVLAALSFSLGITGVAYVVRFPDEIWPWSLLFGQSSVVPFLLTPLWFFAVLTGAPLTRMVAWFSLATNVIIGTILYWISPAPDVNLLAAGAGVATNFPVALFYLWPRQAPDLSSRLVMAKMLVLLLIGFNTFVILGITSCLTPVIDHKIVFLENLLHLTGYLGNPIDIYASGHIRTFIKIIYLFIPLFIMFFVIFLKRAHQTSSFFSSYILSIIVGTSLYTLAPAVGPAAILLVFPDTQLHALGWNQLYFPTGDSPRNAMPSLHTTWSLLMIFCCLRLQDDLRFFFIFIALASAAGTLTTYNHWLIDLGVAFPLSVACLCVTSYFQTRSRRVASLLLVCSLLLLFWFALFSSPTPPLFGAAVLWLALVTTVLMPVIGLWTLRQEVLDPAGCNSRFS